MLKADLIQGTRLLAQERLLDAPEPARAVGLASPPPAEEMSSLERFEYFRPRRVPPEPSDETPEAVTTDDGDAGESDDYSRADHVHSADIPEPATATPSTISGGAGAVGTSAKYARQDHAHPYTPPGGGPDLSDDDPEYVTGDGNEGPGISADASRADHVHALPLPSPDSEDGPGLVFFNDGGVQKLKVKLHGDAPLRFDGSDGGSIYLATGDGLAVISNQLIVPLGNGLAWSGGSVYVNTGSGLSFGEGGVLQVQPGNGLQLSGGALTIKLRENPSLLVDGDGMKVAAGTKDSSIPYKNENGDTRYIHVDANKLIISWNETSS